MKSPEKLIKLKTILSPMKKIVLAFSGGVDSSFLLNFSASMEGLEIIAVSFITPLLKKEEADYLKKYVSNVEHCFLDIDILNVEEVRINHPERCYYCKKYMFSELKKFSDDRNIPYIIEGSNFDDLNDYRPGRKALKEYGIHSPLAEAELTKQEIRSLAKKAGMSEWDLPSSPCLATRFPSGQIISPELLDMAEAAEKIISDLGFSGFRVRVHGNLARIEPDPEKISLFADETIRKHISVEFKKIGFKYISIDIDGYRIGSMNS